MEITSEILKRMSEHRPSWPKRAVVTSGMPYGNKSLHCGHITLFIHSDFFARFLRDRIGSDNVIYVSGTDCHGSPILEGYRKTVEKNEFNGTIAEYVQQYHKIQKDILDNYNISLNLFGASGLGKSKDIHQQMSNEVFNRLLETNNLSPLKTLQFYDEDRQTFLNGRQVMGKCPFEGCMSEHAYADECDLGHQYMPQELINPISSLSGKTPVLKEIGNWYFNLENYIDLLKEWTAYLNKETPTRSYVTKEINEFLKKPELYVKKEYLDQFKAISNLPKYELIVDNKPSFTVVFDKLTDRETACDILTENGVRYRTGKTLVPFRLTGNITWGVNAPDTDELKDLTFWVWPESLWAPISFTRTYLDSLNRQDEWKQWWCDKDAKVYQFIGEDNIYFYGPAQTAMWFAMQGENPTIAVQNGHLSIPQIVANKHTLFLNKKAGSSSAIKPPMANELLNLYSAEQLRFHFLGMNVGNNSSSFMPKPLNPEANPNEQDPVVREYNLLTNVFNRVLRTLCYTWQKDFDGIMPYGTPSEKVKNECLYTILKYDKAVFEHKFHMVCYELDTLIRNINKLLTTYSNSMADTPEGKQILVDALHMARVALTLLHPIAPESVEKVAEFLKLDSSIFSWDNIEKEIYAFVENPTNHKPTFLEPKVDFFTKPSWQFENN
ncbi:MAG: class I tRNA ligase family protein [Clostridia bacterium]|nr:class I tRNA ligase family protein [Clostridia bacterium]